MQFLVMLILACVGNMSNVNHSHVHIVGDCEVWHRSTVKGNGGAFDLTASAIMGYSTYELAL